MTHRSLCSYNITRAYPFKWFTPVVSVGAVILVVLVSFANVAATGYELVSASTYDPNATEANSIWYAKWPGFLTGARASCDASTIPIQSLVYTNNSALPYTLKRVWQVGENGFWTDEAALIYKNNILQNCNVSLVRLQFEGPDRSAGQLAVFTMGGTVTATAQCYVNTGSPGSTYIELVSTYDANPSSSNKYAAFTDLKGVNGSSLYWGYSLLAMYWRSAMQAFFDESVKREPPFSKGVIDLRLNLWLTGTAENNTKNTDFLAVIACWFIPLNSTGIAFLNATSCDTASVSALIDGGSGEKALAGVWNSVNDLAKAMWFTVLADLGRDDDAMPNMLARPKLLEALSSNLTVVNQTLRNEFRWGIEQDNLLLESFDPFVFHDAPLGISPTLLLADYLCQVPRLKSSGNLVVSVLVADLVILQVIWKLFTLFVVKTLIKNEEEARYCATCGPITKSTETLVQHEHGIEDEPESLLLEDRDSSQT
ncbi:hypothetical protein F4809DRAFT_602459 [Biscogniauxia mediterranea]|nr:hypothetical protein F4809DRAFT_602459 [Biscogniauxia mediterranea]